MWSILDTLGPRGGGRGRGGVRSHPSHSPWLRAWKGWRHYGQGSRSRWGLGATKGPWPNILGMTGLTFFLFWFLSLSVLFYVSFPSSHSVLFFFLGGGGGCSHIIWSPLSWMTSFMEFMLYMKYFTLLITLDIIVIDTGYNWHQECHKSVRNPIQFYQVFWKTWLSQLHLAHSPHPPHRQALINLEVFHPIPPSLFGKGIVVHARQTYIQLTKTFTKTKLIWDNNTNCQQL